METEVAKCVSYNISDVANIVMAIASVISLIVSIINIGIVVWIFKKEQKNEKEKNYQDKKENWYDSLGLKDKTIAFSNELNELKEYSVNFFEGVIEQEEYIKKYKQVDIDFLKYKNEYLTIVDCVNDSLAEHLTEEFIQIQDDLYNIVSLMLGDKNLKSITNTQNIIIKLDEIRKKIIKMSINVI